jgi:uncharacterized transporter YbjL
MRHAQSVHVTLVLNVKRVFIFMEADVDLVLKIEDVLKVVARVRVVNSVKQAFTKMDLLVPNVNQGCQGVSSALIRKTALNASRASSM